MLDTFDYMEPACPLCGGEAFYHPKKDDPIGRIPVDRILEKVDTLFGRNDYGEAGKLLVYWRNEAVSLKDKRGELAMENELVGYYRKQNNREEGLTSLRRALTLSDELEQGDMASGATVLINCATAYKAFGNPSEALPLYRHAEAVYQKTVPANDPRFGGLYNNMALTLADLGERDAAEQAYLSALAVMERIPGGQAEAAITYINLAHLYDEWEKKEQVDLCMDKAYRLLQSEELTKNGAYAFVLEKSAPSFAYFGHTHLAEQLTKEAQSIYERA